MRAEPNVSRRIRKQNIQDGNAACIAFITTHCIKAGSYAESTTDVHRTPRTFGIQFSRRRICAGRVSRDLQRVRYAGNGRAGSRRRLRRAALLSCSNQNQSEGAHWLGSDFRLWLALSAAHEIARRLPKFVPLDYAHEITRRAKRRRAPRTGGP